MNKYLRAVLATVAFIVILLSVYYVHMRHFRVSVVLYASVLDAVIATLAACALFALLRWFRDFSRLEVIQLAAIWLLGGYVFAISVPTVIDRSLSFYILEKIQQRGGGVREDAVRQIFTDEYVREHHLMEVRLTEQLQSGTIRIDHGCVKLTERGDRLAMLSRFFRKNLLPTHRLLMGKYTDALTDPFRDSHMSSDYRCQ